MKIPENGCSKFLTPLWVPLSGLYSTFFQTLLPTHLDISLFASQEKRTATIFHSLTNQTCHLPSTALQSTSQRVAELGTGGSGSALLKELTAQRLLHIHGVGIPTSTLTPKPHVEGCGCLIKGGFESHCVAVGMGRGRFQVSIESKRVLNKQAVHSFRQALLQI